jgi:hypothetical protein
MAQTVSSERITPKRPTKAFSVACSRLPRKAFHSQRAISRQLYLLSGKWKNLPHLDQRALAKARNLPEGGVLVTFFVRRFSITK